MLWTTLTKQNNTKKNMIKKSFFQQCANQFCWKHLTVREFVLESNNIRPTSLYSVENVFHFFLMLNFKLLHHCKFHEVSMVLGSRSRQPDWADKSKGITQFPGFLLSMKNALKSTVLHCACKYRKQDVSPKPITFWAEDTERTFMVLHARFTSE